MSAIIGVMLATMLCLGWAVYHLNQEEWRRRKTAWLVRYRHRRREIERVLGSKPGGIWARRDQPELFARLADKM